MRRQAWCATLSAKASCSPDPSHKKLLPAEHTTRPHNRSFSERPYFPNSALAFSLGKVPDRYQRQDGSKSHEQTD